jgi:hypothetical protein
MFLAFPALLPASLTLVAKHDGRAKATDDARGARPGALALFAFSGTILALRDVLPVVALLLAATAWVCAASLLWALAEHLRRP